MHNEYRIGQGYDVHRLVEGRPLILGGVTIKHDKGLYGHSDADVLLHAVTDALFGAAALGDIGRHFPDTDPKYKGADSALLLSEALELVLKKGWMPVNADCTIIAQKPKLAPYMEQINASLSSILRLPIDCVNVKAKTNELLGFEGREEGIVAQAVILLKARS
ncbi:2-C-methyl-D-erythritol 2,4-cyclodiphosphate synthase [uncultured Parasutterella sp.]|uniref:2-C-methyl-D-erythritol 2,4-cyclodiphosphate synthase n=3 Tax=Parasutterella TaxID=577310 RepID=UPI0035198EF4